jgi:muscleblind protein
MEVVTPSLAGAVVIKPAGKDSRWLTLEVCREFARANCPRSAEECKYAHPPPHVEIQSGRVTCCYDSIKVSHHNSSCI